MSTFLFCNDKIVTGSTFIENLGNFWARNREEDNILYFNYSEHPSF